MKRLPFALTTIFACGTVLAAPQTAAPGAVDFSWRQHQGDFPKDKPGYLILTTEDALRWSKVLPDFVKHKEGVGFHVYVVTEKDYASGKTGNEQAFHLRAWLREFQKRTGAKYALFIGDSSPASANLPSPTRPDGERTGMDEAFRDLDGKCNDTGGDWVDAYLRQLPEQPKRTLAAKNELLMGRISYVGDEIGNSAYDLDRILAKFIRYENETLSGKGLDWRARAITVTSNYGGSPWDIPFKVAMEKSGGLFEHHSTSWNMVDGNAPIPDMIPENFQGSWSGHFSLSEQLISQSRPHGLMTNMSHGSNRGSEGIIGPGELFREMDDRYPAVVGVAACTAFHLADNCNMGQSHLRRNAVFAFGTSHSGNNGYRISALMKLVEDRGTIGEAFDALDAYSGGITWYGDPSLRVIAPPKGEPLTSLQVNPTIGYHYEERALDYSKTVKPFAQSYTLANNTKQPMTVAVSTGVDWLTASATKLELAPGKSATVEVKSNATLNQTQPGVYHAAVRFRDVRGGNEEERRISLTLQPLALASYHSFDAEANQPAGQPPKAPVAFRDFVLSDVPGSIAANEGTLALPPQAAPNKDGSPAPEPTMAWEEKGRIGGAVHFNGKGQSVEIRTADYLSWRGLSASFWVKLDALPEKGQTVLVRTPFTLAVTDKGELTIAREDKPVVVGTVEAGKWHFIALRSDLAREQIKAGIDNKPEVANAFSSKRSLGNRLTFGPFAGCLDEVKLWSGEWSDADRFNEHAAAGRTIAVANPVPGLRALAPSDVRLQWRPINRPADAKYVVYLGESEAAVAAATEANHGKVLAMQTTDPWVTPVLSPGKTYFWRVDIAGQASRGPVWSFKTLAAPFQTVRPLAEGSAAADPRQYLDPHRGQLLRTPTLYEFQVPADAKPAAAFLHVKGFPNPWYASPAFTLHKIESGLEDWKGGAIKPDAYKNAVKTQIATGVFDPAGNWLDVSAHLTPGKTVRFALEVAPNVGLSFFSLTNEECRGPFGSGDVNQPITPKLILYPKDTPPMAIVSALPKAVTLTEAAPMVDLGALLPKVPGSAKTTFTLTGAPEWAQVSADGKVSLRSGTRFDDLDFGGYNGVLSIQVAGARTYERPLKIRIPVPQVSIKMDRSKGGTISFVPVNANVPLSKGTIRYTTDGSPVLADSPVFTQPIPLTEGMKPQARFFYLDQYPMATVGAQSEFGIDRSKWKVTEVAGNPATLGGAAQVFDGRNDTAWKAANPTGFPQQFTWDMGEEVAVTRVLCQSTIRNSDGRVNDYTLQASDDGKTWRQIQAGTFDDTPVAQSIKLPGASKARYLRLEVASLHAGTAMVLTELDVYTK